MGVTPDKDLSNSGQTPATSETPAQPPVPAPVHKVGQHKPQNNGFKPQQSKQLGTCKSECYRCGGSHNPSGCPCKEYVCHFCKKKDHLAKKRRKKSKSRTEAHQCCDRRGDPGRR